MFLTTAQLHALTKRSTRPAQIRRLKAMGIPYIDDPAAANLKVLRSVVERAGGNDAANDDPTPDFTWMRKRA